MSAKTNAARREEWTAQRVASSRRFVACSYIGGPAMYDKREALTLDEARALARDIIREQGETNARRPVMIYAITHDNLSVHVENLAWQPYQEEKVDTSDIPEADEEWFKRARLRGARQRLEET